MSTQHITIGPEFFTKAKNDYADWKWSFVREGNQNSMDCGSRTISWLIEEDGGKTRVVVRNDGEPMTEETLIGKLLCLGGSGKNFEGENAGGFGKAKELLYLCHERYTIHSGSIVVTGSGADYHRDEAVSYMQGTESVVIMDGCHKEALEAAVRRFAELAQWKGTFDLNGSILRCSLRKGSPRRDLGFGTVYTNKSFNHLLVVRIDGQPMFTESIALDRCVVVELTGKSDDILTSNRDGLVRPFSSELSGFITELAVDKKSALKNRNIGPRYTRYSGSRLSYSRNDPLADVLLANSTSGIRGLVSGAAPTATVDELDGVDVDGNDEVNGPEFRVDVESGGVVRAKSFPLSGSFPDRTKMWDTIGTEFTIKNETKMVVPEYYKPEGELSTHSKKLIKSWGRIMLELHRLFDREDSFSIGFLFSDDAEAMHEQGNYGRIYFLNPAVIVEQRGSYSKSFKKRFKLTERNRLIMIGLHEFVHGLGLSWHDERYACKLTDMAWKVMDSRKRFNWCFAA